MSDKTFEQVKDAVLFASDLKYSTDFFDGYSDAAKAWGDNIKIFDLSQCAELAECSIYTLEEIKKYFWNEVD